MTDEIRESIVSKDSGGTPFDDGPRGRIKAIHVKHGGQIDSIKITYTDGEGGHHGGQGGVPVSAELEDGEDIIEVIALEHIKKGYGLEYLHFRTTKGRLIEFNTIGATTQGDKKKFTAPPGYVLGGIHGKSFKYLNTIGVYWVSLSKPEPPKLEMEPESPNLKSPVASENKEEKSAARPCHCYLLFFSFILLVVNIVFPAWSRYSWDIADGSCTTRIGPWGYSTIDSDDGDVCDSGFEKHGYDFYCDLDIPNTDQIKSLDSICKRGIWAGYTVFIGACVALLFGMFAFFSNMKAWRNHSWKKDKKLIYASITFSILAFICADVSWIAWVTANDTMTTVLKETDNYLTRVNDEAKLYLGFFLQIIASLLIKISLVCDIHALLNWKEISESEEKTLTTPLMSNDV